MNELALFAGAGGGILGGHLLGWRTVCAVEWEPYAASVLVSRQNDKVLPPFPIWDDVQTFDGRPWQGIVDVVSGGFPCQDISTAGKGAGITGKRSGMWSHMARIIGDVQPQFVFVENSPALTTRGLGRVLGDLAEMGFNAEWCVLSAAAVGAPHKRDRIWILAHSNIIDRRSKPQQSNNYSGEKIWDELKGSSNGINKVAHSNSTQCKGGGIPSGIHSEYTNFNGEGWWETEPDVGRVAYGVAAGVDRLKAIGNGQVPIVAATAFKLLKERLGC